VASSGVELYIFFARISGYVYWLIKVMVALRVICVLVCG
jgi:hypothetical protein